jgi:hypothetical protein
MTQREIYELVKFKPEGWQDKMRAAKAAGLIAYDHEELWNRPVAEIGTPIDDDLYDEFWLNEKPRKY